MTQALSSPTRMSRTVIALILSPAVILTAAATRLIVISNHDTTVAVTIASSGGVTGTLLGTVVPLLPAYLPLMVLVLILFRRVLFAVLAAVATALVSPAYVNFADGWRASMDELREMFRQIFHWDWVQVWGQHRGALVCIIVGVIFALWNCAQIQFRDAAVITPSLRLAGQFGWGLVYATTCLVGLLLVQSVYRVPFDFENFDIIMRRPWVPAEEITLKNNQMHVGYTISSKDGWFLVLNEHDRSLDYINANAVVHRRTCTPPALSPDYRDPLHRLQGAQPPVNSLCRERTRPAVPPPSPRPSDGGPARTP